MSDKFKEQEEYDKRLVRSRDVRIVFPMGSEGNYSDFIVIDEQGVQKYDGFAAKQPSDKDDCKCPNFTNNNFSKDKGSHAATHGFSFQCKHIMEARHQGNLKREEDAVTKNFNDEMARKEWLEQ